jgi:hypothetical protein
MLGRTEETNEMQRVSHKKFIGWTCLLLIVILSSIPSTSRAASLTVCSEDQFERALTDAHDGDTIRFVCSDPVTTITFGSQKPINKNITLDGSGQQITISGGRPVQLLAINRGATVKIKHLTFADARSQVSGGAIDNRGTLIISESTFTRNIHAISNFGDLTIEDSTFADNVINAIYNRRSVTIRRSLFTGNAHGIDNDYGTVIAVNTIFANNKFLQANGIGAGIANSGTVTVINSTFDGNEASGGGGAIGTHFGGKVTLINTIIANSSRGINCFGPMIDGGHNLQFPGKSCGDSITSADPKLLSLSDQTGIMPTVGLQVDSPAIGAGDPDQCKQSPVDNQDQRGFLRITPAEPTCDIGAYEFQVTSAELRVP